MKFLFLSPNTHRFLKGKEGFAIVSYSRRIVRKPFLGIFKNLHLDQAIFSSVNLEVIVPT